jgi:hypothetical protein
MPTIISIPPIAKLKYLRCFTILLTSPVARETFSGILTTTNLPIPKREFNRLSAELESVDKSFQQLVDNTEKYRYSLNSYFHYRLA